ncbi:MAG: hypothetical protein RBT34_05285 [Anaerolineaceae bacterium]|jgi:hypothetical protein|nr:hypothetical protein [Anaerolineaceae bacterium]
MNQQLRIETIGRFAGVFLGAVVSIFALVLAGPSVEGAESSTMSDLMLVLSAVLLIGVYLGVSKLAERYGHNKARQDMLSSQEEGKARLAEEAMESLPGVGDAPSSLNWQAHETTQEFLEEGETVLGYAAGWVSALDSLFVITDRAVHILRVNRDYTRHSKGFHFVFKRDGAGIRLKSADADRNDARFGFVRRFKIASLEEDQKDLVLLLWLYGAERTGLSNPKNDLFEQTLEEMKKDDFAAEEEQRKKGLTGKMRSWFMGKRF